MKYLPPSTLAALIAWTLTVPASVLAAPPAHYQKAIVYFREYDATTLAHLGEVELTSAHDLSFTMEDDNRIGTFLRKLDALECRHARNAAIAGSLRLLVVVTDAENHVRKWRSSKFEFESPSKTALCILNSSGRSRITSLIHREYKHEATHGEHSPAK